jgi:hypothetical protein
LNEYILTTNTTTEQLYIHPAAKATGILHIMLDKYPTLLRNSPAVILFKLCGFNLNITTAEICNYYLGVLKSIR